MRKLLKYEMRAMNRRLCPIYLGLLAVALLNYLFGFGMFLRSSNTMLSQWLLDLPDFVHLFFSTVQTVITVLFFGLMFGMIIVWLLTTLNRFRKGLLGAEGYLMFTLPVTTGQLIGAKLLASCIHLMLSGIVALLSFCILLGLPDLFLLLTDIDWPATLAPLTHVLPSWPLFVVWLLVLTVLSGFPSILHFYLAMAIGQLTDRHRTLLSVLAYIGISTALSTISSLFFGGISLLAQAGLLDFLLDALTRSPQLAAHLFFLFLILLTVLEGLLFWIPTRYILENHLNLE